MPVRNGQQGRSGQGMQGQQAPIYDQRTMRMPLGGIVTDDADEYEEPLSEEDDTYPGAYVATNGVRMNYAPPGIAAKQRKIVFHTVPPRLSRASTPSYPNTAPPPKTAQKPQPTYEEDVAANKRAQSRSGAHPLLYLGLGMLVMLGLWTAFTSGGTWVQNEDNQLTYGYPRTFQIDAVVGHHDSTRNPSHFLAVNLHGQIIIVEFPGGDASKGKDYFGPELLNDNADLVPVTLSFQTVHAKVDMFIHVQGKTITYINTGDGFRPLQPGEHL